MCQQLIGRPRVSIDTFLPAGVASTYDTYICTFANSQKFHSLDW